MSMLLLDNEADARNALALARRHYLTWSFLAQASPATREELRRFLTAHGWHPVAGLGAFLDGLQFSAEHRSRRGPEPRRR